MDYWNIGIMDYWKEIYFKKMSAFFEINLVFKFINYTNL